MPEPAIEAPSGVARPEELRVLLLVPTLRDASVAARLLSGGRLEAVSCRTLAELVAEIGRGAAAVLTTEELLGAGKPGPLIGLLGGQEEWSDLPFVVLISGGSDSPKAVSALDQIPNVTILERPAPFRSVLSAVQAAVRGRLRQYQMRTQVQAIREAEAKAQRSERAKDDFLAALSHELRTPLNPVLLLASEATLNPDLPEAVRADFEVIARNVSLEARLIDDLLDLTRITRGKLKLELAPLEFARVVRDALTTVQADFTEKSIMVETDFADGYAVVEGDAVRLQQVIWNVLKNAAKFTPAGGRIWIRTSRQGARVEAEIRDSGVGMTRAELQRVFEAFAQGDHSDREGPHRFGGLGLGLAISRSLVKLHNGEIVAASAGLGQGSTLTIALPLAAVQGPAGGSTPPIAPMLERRPSRPSLCILLVEDHVPTRAVLSSLLRQRRHEVRSAGSVAEAREAAAGFNFDLLMTDLGLPDGSGYELFSELSRGGPVRGVALTGFGMDEDILRSEKAGFLTHLIKPIQVQTLDMALAAVVAHMAEAP